MSNYPEGVSPSDPHIVGLPERDASHDVECNILACTFRGNANGTETLDHGTVRFFWKCPRCGWDHDIDYPLGDIPPIPDELCAVDGCTLAPHDADTPHTWEHAPTETRKATS